MDSVISKIQNIELKVKKMSLVLEQYKTDCSLLKDENLRLKRSLAKYEGSPSEPNPVEFTMPIASIPTPKVSVDNEALKVKFDRYIKEVDKCIELVNNW